MPFDFSQTPDRSQTNSLKWTRYPKNVLPLWVADMDFPAPPAINEALARAVAHGVHGYEFPSKHLRKITAARMEKLYGWQVKPEWVIATPGIIAGFNAAAWAVCEPGQGILTQPPVYPPFLSLHKNIGLTHQDAPLLALTPSPSPSGRGVTDHLIRYEIDFEQFEAAFDKNAPTRMFLLCNPHNPTGRAFNRQELLKMAEICLAHDTVIVSDEIHSELTLPPNRHIPIASLSPEIEARSITLIAPSKTFNVPGLFTGFAIIPNAELRRKFRHETERLCMHVNSLGLVAAEAAFSGACDEWLDELRVTLVANRDFVTNFVRDNLPGARVTQPEATYLSWLDFRALNLSPDPYQFLLKKAKVALTNGKDFGEGGQGFARLNFGCPRTVLADALGEIATIWPFQG
jgi:cysteine-S-conjugate beta-lyase